MAWNGSADNGEATSRRLNKTNSPLNKRQDAASPIKKGLLVGLIVVMGGGLAAWFFTGERGERGERGEIKASRIAEVKPQIATNVVEAEVPAVAKKDVRMERGVEVVAVSARTNQSGVVVEKLTLADGRKIEKVIRPKPIFDNVSDQMIALAVSAKPGESMAPLPALGDMDEEFAKSLLSPIRIDEGDSEKVKELKLAVKEARAYIAAEIKAGRSVAECLQEHRERMEDISDRHTMAVQEMQKMRKDGASAEDIAAFRSRINEIFKEQGIPELPTRSENKKPGRKDTEE